MEGIKEAFAKVKEDIFYLKSELDFFKKSLIETREKLSEVCSVLSSMNERSNKILENQEKSLYSIKEEIVKLNNQFSLSNPAQNQIIPTDRQQLQNIIPIFNPLNNQISGISTGNEGVPTDRQTNQQTNQQTNNFENGSHNNIKITSKPLFNSQNKEIDKMADMMDSLDNIKKEIRLKFKRLTDQEWLIFSTIYQLEEENEYVDYKMLSEKLNLTQSSIRDYVGRIINKGISLDKNKINNKTIHLSISQNLKKIATLSTILQLREI